MTYYNLAQHMNTTVSIPCNKDFANTVVSILRKHETNGKPSIMRMFAYDPRTHEIGINTINGEPDAGYETVMQIFYFFEEYQIAYCQLHGMKPYFKIQHNSHMVKITCMGDHKYNVSLHESMQRTIDGEYLYGNHPYDDFKANSIKDIANNPSHGCGLTARKAANNVILYCRNSRV